MKRILALHNFNSHFKYQDLSGGEILIESVKEILEKFKLLFTKIFLFLLINVDKIDLSNFLKCPIGLNVVSSADLRLLRFE